MSKAYKISVLLFVFCLCCSERISLEKRQLLKTFEDVDGKIYSGKGLSEFNNKSGFLAWGESFVLRSYAEMYSATRNIDYLEKVIDHFDRMLKHRDDRYGKRDKFMNKVYPAWGSSKFTMDKWRAWLVHQGMILYPVMMFVDFVKSDSSLVREYGEKADFYLSQVQKTIDSYNDQWISEGDWGYYQYPEGIHNLSFLPFNEQNAAGRVLILLTKVTGKSEYSDKAERLARDFKKSLIYIEDKNAYKWIYSAPSPRELNPSGAEDISHASINIDFAVLAYNNGIVFDETDMERFSNTFTKLIYLGPEKFSTHVDGTRKGREFRNIERHIGKWLSLSQFNREVYEIIYDYYTILEKDRQERSKPQHYTYYTSYLLSTALLYKYSD